ncbi:sensor histidine kinase [Actinomadura roseirufa]|uniref:sensor histidine kinase n=1 Tax=Actinomadura roseirufa TaxID=2094049 RepID=UPI0010416431|nr:sensor histidine kinase [Actinomadura roseirufa]
MRDAGGSGPAGAGADGDPPRWTGGWRRALLAAGMFVYPAIALAGVAQYSRGGAAAAGYAVVVAFCCCYALAALSFAGGSKGRTRGLLAAMAVLAAGAVPFAREIAFYLTAVVVSFTIVVLKRHVPLLIGAGALAALLVPWAVRPWHQDPALFEALAIVFTALAVYAFLETAQANVALVEARAEVARLASDAERARIARDLHDLLGHSLTVITVKSGLARRLAGDDPARSLAEITEVEHLSRQALGDVRAAVSGYRTVTLAGELARGRELLRASGVAADLPAAADVVAAEHQELFGWVVREGLTNVVRHARATRCTVTVTATQVQIRDDGAGGPSPAGHGLTGLRERVAAAGGTVEAGPVAPRGWRLTVTLGASPSPSLSPSPSTAPGGDAA